MKAGFHWKALFDEANVAKAPKEPAKLPGAVLTEYRRVLVLQGYLHDNGHRVQPGQTVVYLENSAASRREHAPALVDERLGMGRVLHDAVGEHEVDAPVPERQLFAVGIDQIGAQSLLIEVGIRERDRGRRNVDPDRPRATSCETNQIGPRTAANIEDAPAPVRAEIDQPYQMVQLFKMVRIEIAEKPRGSHGVRRDLEVVDVLIPVAANISRARRGAG